MTGLADELQHVEAAEIGQPDVEEHDARPAPVSDLVGVAPGRRHVHDVPEFPAREPVTEELVSSSTIRSRTGASGAVGGWAIAHAGGRPGWGAMAHDRREWRVNGPAP